MMFCKIRSNLMECYMTQFRRVRPFSLPFTFDIENTWVSLALRTEKGLCRTEDHCGVLKNLFTKEDKLIIVQGSAASGKTSLMRRYAYDWANQHIHQQMKQFDLVLLAEFREVQKKRFKSIAGLALASMKKTLLTDDEHDRLKNLLTDFDLCVGKRILILLDGFDEASSNDQCEELFDLLTRSKPRQPLQFYVILSTRPGYTSMYDTGKQFVEVIGFDTIEQKTSYIKAHFANEVDSEVKIETVQKLLQENENLSKLAETPLLLTFICLLHTHIHTASLFEMYSAIIWYLLDRYQKSFPEKNVPVLFDYHSSSKSINYLQIIQDSYITFPVIMRVGKMAFEMFETVEFVDEDLKKFEIPEIVVSVGLLRKEERRDEILRLNTIYVFPHRTIQEFFAGGMFYFWPVEPSLQNEAKSVKTINFRKIDFSDSDHDFSGFVNHLPDNFKMNELEKFIWRISLRSNFEIEPELISFFQRYETLTIDLSIFPCQHDEYSVWLNTYLAICQNVTVLIIYTTQNVIINTSIQISHLHLLESLCFFGSMMHKIFMQSSIQTDGSSSFCPVLAKPAKLMNHLNYIAFNGCTFHDERIFLATMDILEVEFPHSTLEMNDFELVSSCQTNIIVPKIRKLALSVHYCRSSLEKEHKLELINEESGVCRVLKKLRQANEITIICPVSSSSQNLKTSIVCPTLDVTEKLFAVGCFNILTFALFTRLTEFHFEESSSENQSSQSRILNRRSLICSISHQKVLKILSIKQVSRELEHLYELRSSDSIVQFFLAIKDGIDYSEGVPVFTTLAQSMRDLQIMQVTVEYGIGTWDEVTSTGKLRNENFKFTFITEETYYDAKTLN